MLPNQARHPHLVRFAALLCAAGGLLGLLAPPSTAERVSPVAPAADATALATSSAAPDQESAFVGRINSLRASKGLSQLSVSGELVGVARSWTERMVQAGQISHNPNLGSQVGGDWTKLGENVGVGYDVDGLMQAFINSSAHYANLVDPEWTHVGVGVVMAGDGRMYTTHNFMALSSAPPAPAPEPEPAPSPTPAPSSGGSSGSGGSAPEPSSDTPTEAPVAPAAPPAPARPEPTPERVTAVLDPLRSLES